MKQGLFLCIAPLFFGTLAICAACAPEHSEPAQPAALKGLSVMSAQEANICFVQPTPELKAKLSKEQWDVLVNAATEPPFRNAYWNNHQSGVYVDAIDGTPLFSSGAKFDSGSGWPSFWEPLDMERIVLVEDTSYGMQRTEVRAKASGGHLGHVFPDGPQPSGLRYCINSASLRFIAAEDLAKEGYPELAALFTGK